jgi:hypothetical protein
MIKENFKMTGSLEIAINGDTVCKTHNLVVAVGKEHVTKRLEGTTEGVMSHMAIGSDNTTAADANTTLGAASGTTELGRVAYDSGFPDISGTNTIKYEATFPAGTGTGAVTEAGLFNASSTGQMLARTVFSTVNKGATDVMTITWTIEAS